MTTAIVWFTRDLRVNDQPALHAAAACEHVVPLFVLDDAILRSAYAAPNRLAFLFDCLRDLDAALRRRGAALVVRRGDAIAEVVRMARAVDAAVVHASADVSGYAQRRAARVGEALAAEHRPLVLHPGVTVQPRGSGAPAGRDHAVAFTPYLRKWVAAPRRAVVSPPRRLRLPDGIDPGRIPDGRELGGGSPAPDLPPGGEAAARRRLTGWLGRGLAGYPDGHDDLAGDATSRLSPYLHFGCLSPAEVVDRAGDRPGAAAFVRQLAWRDFYHQLLAARPAVAVEDFRPRGDAWRTDPDALAAWRDGRTGYPVIDAAMRQLRAEGWMHNRARLLVASFLTKDLYLDWRSGARHFLDHLVDGDVANNQLNWQWVAGTGTDTRPNRVFSPLRQAERFDPSGDYVRRYLPELADVPGPAVHRPWKLPEPVRRRLDYPAPLVDHAAAVRRFRETRAARRA